MNTVRQTQRVTRRRRGDIYAETILNVDLNSPPIECWVVEGNSSSVGPSLSLGSAASTNKPIDLEAIEDEVELLSSLRGFPQSRRLSRRNQPIVILDEDFDTNGRRSGLGNAVEDPITTLNRKRGRAVIRDVINCELYPDEDDDNAKGKKVIKSVPEPPKEPTFNCPICMNSLVDASSTICGHVFCHGCIKKSIQVQKKCPTCRKKLNMNNFHRVYFPSCE